MWGGLRPEGKREKKKKRNGHRMRGRERRKMRKKSILGVMKKINK